MSERQSNPKEFWKLAALGVFVLAVSGWILNGRVNAMVQESGSDRQLIRQTVPGLNTRTIPELQEEINDLKSQIFATATLFNPQAKWIREGYDVSILFVEELNNANESLKESASALQVQFPGIAFSEKLPGEEDAVKLLTQLYGIREVCALAISLGADILDIAPGQAIEDEQDLHSVVLPSTIELSLPHETVVEFLIRLTGIVPKIAVDTLTVKAEDEAVLISLGMQTIYTHFTWTDEEKDRYRIAGVPEESYPQGIQRAVALLRANSPFAIPERRQEEILLAEEGTAKAQPEVVKPRQRFFFRGKGMLHGHEVAVIEDTLRQETIFLSRGERYDTFLLQDFSEDGVILEGIDDGVVTVVNREDQ